MTHHEPDPDLSISNIQIKQYKEISPDPLTTQETSRPQKHSQIYQNTTHPPHTHTNLQIYRYPLLVILESCPDNQIILFPRIITRQPLLELLHRLFLKPEFLREDV